MDIPNTKEGDPNTCNKSIADNKSFSFKNVSNKNKGKNDEKDTINDMLNSQNSSRKSLIKENEISKNDLDYSRLGFSNLGIGLDTKPVHLEKEGENDQKSLASFGQKIRNKIQPKSPVKNNYVNDNNSRFLRPLFDDAPNHSMMCVNDDNSNNIEHKFMFANDTKISRMDEGPSMSMMFNQNSNQYHAYQGTPNKIDVSQHPIFDHGDHSNLSAMFPNLGQEDHIPKKLFHKEMINEDSQLGINLLQGPHETIHDHESGKENEDFELAHHNFENIPEPEKKINEDIPISMNDGPKGECSLPHPNDFFGLKDGKMSKSKLNRSKEAKSTKKTKNKRNK